MPKAVVQRATVDDGVDATEVTLHWSKEASHVQLSIRQFPNGVMVVDGAVDEEGLPIVEPRGSIDAEKVAAAEAGTGPDNPYARERFEAEDVDTTSHALFSNAMTRYQINELIRSLRRARDAAFGADA